LEDPNSSQNCDKVFDKDKIPPQNQKTPIQTTARQQRVIKARLKLVMQNFFCKIDLQLCEDGLQVLFKG
jgi:hypothetical protein